MLGRPNCDRADSHVLPCYDLKCLVPEVMEEFWKIKWSLSDCWKKRRYHLHGLYNTWYGLYNMQMIWQIYLLSALYLGWNNVNFCRAWNMATVDHQKITSGIVEELNAPCWTQYHWRIMIYLWLYPNIFDCRKFSHYQLFFYRGTVMFLCNFYPF